MSFWEKAGFAAGPGPGGGAVKRLKDRIAVKRIPIDQAQPGQILAQKLTRGDGVLLAGQGAEVTEGLLRMLARMNIDSIVVEEEISLSPEEVADIYQKRVTELDGRFVKVESQPVLAALKAALIDLAAQERDAALAAIAPPTPAEAEEERAEK